MLTIVLGRDKSFGGFFDGLLAEIDDFDIFLREGRAGSVEKPTHRAGKTGGDLHRSLLRKIRDLL